MQNLSYENECDLMGLNVIEANFELRDSTQLTHLNSIHFFNPKQSDSRNVYYCVCGEYRNKPTNEK